MEEDTTKKNQAYGGDSANLDFLLWKKFETFFKEQNFIHYPTSGIVDNSSSSIYNPKAGLSEIGNIIASNPVEETIPWINLSPVFRYKNLPLSSVSRNDLAFFDTITYAFAVPAKEISLRDGISNTVAELNKYYTTHILEKGDREAVYRAFLDFSKEERLPVGHDYIMSDEFMRKYVDKRYFQYKEELVSLSKDNICTDNLYQYIASLSMVRMTQKFNQRFDVYRYLFSFLETLGIKKDNLYFTIHGGGHPVNNFFIPEEMLLKKVLINSFGIAEKRIIKIENENTLEIFLEEKYPQIGPRSQVLYNIPGTDEMVELGVATFSEYFVDFGDNTIKYAENFVSRFSFGLQRLNMIIKIDNGQKIDIKDVSLFSKIIEEVKDVLRRKKTFEDEKSFAVEKRDILKIGQYLMSIIMLLAERIDLDKDKNSPKYKQFQDVFDTLSKLFLHLHLLKKDQVFGFIYDITDIVTDHYKILYPELYSLSEDHKEKIVSIIAKRILETITVETTQFKSLVNQDWK